MEKINKLLDLRENRFSNPLTQKEMANKLELSTSQQYQKYEYDPESLSKKAIEKASSFFKVSPQYFLDNSYGKIMCDAPYFKDFDYKKKRIIFYDFEEKSKIITINTGNSFITDFFILNFKQSQLNKIAISQYIRSYSRHTNKVYNEPNLLVLENDATLVECDDEPVVTFLMKKAGLNDLKSQNSPNLYLIMSVKSKKLFLIYAAKLNNNSYNITTIYDFDRNIILDLCPSFAIEGEDIKIGSTINLKDTDLSNFHIIGKAISIWNPKDLFPFEENRSFYINRKTQKF